MLSMEACDWKGQRQENYHNRVIMRHIERVRMRIGRWVEEIMIVTRMREGSTHNPLAA